MDPIITPATPSNPRADGSPSFSVRQMWQVPVFFVGLVAVVTACLTRGLVAPDPVRQLHHDLAEARRLLHHHAGDPDGALRYARQAVDNLMYDPTRSAEAFFLLGSAQLHVAEQASEAPDEETWRQAKQSLQEAERRGLAGDDLNRLHYRLAKVGFHMRDNPIQVIELLKLNTGAADDRAEALTLLSQAYLRLTPPNVKKALEANKKLREEVPQIGEDVLGPAKLAGAKLLLQLNQRDEARRTLEKISDQAPPAILSEKHMLLAGLYQEESKWTEAAALWRTVLAEQRVPLTEAGGVLYNLGVCCRRLDRLSQAAEAWSDCLHRAKGEEAQAAALALAELRLQEKPPDKAVAMLAEAVAKIRKADDWKNSLVELPRVRELFEQAITTYRQAQRFDLAVQSAELYERVAAPPKAQIHRAELNGEWASSQRELARSAKDAAARKKVETTADELLRQAADAHSEAAKLLHDKKERDEHLWRSAVCSFEGHDYRRAADKLTTIVAGKTDDVDRQSEAWFLLGETCRHLNDNKAACEAYRKCVEKDARFTCRARYQLAMIEIETGHIDDAVKELEQNLGIVIEYQDPDPEVHEKSLFALCSLLYQGGPSLPQNYRRVVQHLEGPLDHFSTTPEAVRARFQLADSYCQLVAQDRINRSVSEQKSSEAFAHLLEMSKRSWTRAAEEFTKLEDLVKDAEMASLLSLKQQVEIPFRIAECYYNLGEYEKALHKYEDVARKWGKHQYALRALGETIKCFASMEDYKQLHQRAEEIRGMLATAEQLTQADREQWIDWLNKVNKAPAANRARETNRDEQPRIINGRPDEPQIRNERGPLPR
jgi:tetratricopeptide (TPR) repeat protein